MRDEVDEFLKRVAQMRQAAEAQAKAQQQRPSATKPPEKPPARPPAPPRPPSPPRLAPQPLDFGQVEPLAPAVVEAELSDRQSDFSRRVAHDLRGATEIAEHTRHLGEEVDLADDKLEARLHQVFDHQVGQLRKSTMEAAAILSTDPAAAGTAINMMQMLRSPQAIRDAIVMSEILRRPDELW